MESYLLYIGKASLAAGTFYLLYLALFQHQKHFVFNRIYLPISLALSFLIPLITFTTLRYIEPIQSLSANSFAYLPGVMEIAEPEFVYQWYHYLTGIYLLGIIGFLFHLLLGHFRAISIIRFSRLKELFGACVNVSEKDIHPFSFFNKIVLSEKTLDNPNLEIIISHEKIHVDEKHTLDVLFAEILFLLQWFNPFAWLIKDAIRNNLEYLTDHQIAQTNNAEAYQLAMVGLVHKKGVAPFLTALNGSQLKTRIIMMKKKTENKYAILKQLVVLPLLAVLIMGLSNKEVKTEFVQAASQETEDSKRMAVQVIIDGKEISLNEPELIDLELTTKATSKLASLIVDAFEIELDKVKYSRTAETADGRSVCIRTTDYAKGSNPEFEQKFPIPHSSIVAKSTSITSTKIETESKHVQVVVDGMQISNNHPDLKSIDFSEGFDGGEIIDALNLGEKVESNYLSIDENANEIVYYIRTNDYVPGTNVEFDKLTSEANETGKPNVKFVSNADTKEMVITGKVTNLKGEAMVGATVIVNNTSTGTITDTKGNYEIKVSGENSVLLYRMLGYEYRKTPAIKENINVVLTPTSIDSNKIYPYGILVKDKSKVSEQDTNSVKVVGYGNLKNVPKKEAVQIRIGDDKLNQPLFIVDGKETESIEQLDKEDIESMSVLKGESAIDLYGEKGKNGVVLINTKASGVKGHVHKVEDESEIKVTGYGTQIKPTTVDSHVDASKTVFLKSLTGEDQPLYIVDGKEVENLDKIEVDEVESITVLKDESAKSLYGEKGKNGVVLVITKETAKNKSTSKVYLNSEVSPPKFTIKGKVTNEAGEELPAVSIVIKNENVGTVTNIDGLFEIGSETEIKTLVCSYGGYKKQEIKVKGKSELVIELKRDKNAVVVGYPSNNKNFLKIDNTFSSKTPLILIDGVPTVKDVNDIDPENIEAINILKDASAVALYGNVAKDGVILITTKQKEITSELELRKFIAEKIRYPLKPQQDNQEGISKIYVKIVESGTITSFSDEKVKDAIHIDEVVVASYKTGADDEATEEKLDDYSKYFNVETKHVIYQLPKIDIDEFKGKTIVVTVKFVLQ